VQLVVPCVVIPVQPWTAFPDPEFTTLQEANVQSLAAPATQLMVRELLFTLLVETEVGAAAGLGSVEACPVPVALLAHVFEHTSATVNAWLVLEESPVALQEVWVRLVIPVQPVTAFPLRRTCQDANVQPFNCPSVQDTLRELVVGVSTVTVGAEAATAPLVIKILPFMGWWTEQ